MGNRKLKKRLDEMEGRFDVIISQAVARVGGMLQNHTRTEEEAHERLERQSPQQPIILFIENTVSLQEFYRVFNIQPPASTTKPTTQTTDQNQQDRTRNLGRRSTDRPEALQQDRQTQNSGTNNAGGGYQNDQQSNQQQGNQQQRQPEMAGNNAGG